MKSAIQGFSFLFVIVVLSASCNNNAGGTKENKFKIDSLTQQITLLTDSQNLEDINKKMVADFYQQLFGDKDTTAIDRYIGDVYIQHNPSLPDGKEALKKAAAEWFKGVQKEKINFQHLAADGDLVFIHTKSQRGSKTTSVLDIFRVEKGKIVEHWDVMQDVPEKSANDHPMF